MVKLRAGIIGLGVGAQHAVAYDRHPHSEVAALCDFDQDKLAAAGRDYPRAKLYGAAEDLLADPSINVVSIASYDNFHYVQARQAMLAGKHVFVEKPLCLYAEEARALRTLLRDHPRVMFGSNLILRKVPRFGALKQMISGNELGDIFCVEGDYNYGRLAKLTDGWRGRIDFYSVVYGGAVHMVDLLLWLTGDRVVEVSAWGNRTSSRGSQFKYDDTVMSLLRFESGLVGKISSNYGCVMPHFHGLTVYGTKGTFINGPDHALLYRSREPSEPPEKITTEYPAVDKGDLVYDFVDAIASERKPLVGTEEVFRSMSICFAIEQAADRGETVRVDYI